MVSAHRVGLAVGSGIVGANGRGGAASMNAAMADAGIKPEAVQYINAHGTSTVGDEKG